MTVNSLDRDAVVKLAHNIAKSLRPQIVVLSWFVYACVVTAHNGFDVLSVALGIVLFIAMYGVVALQNDLSDIETDTLNHRKDIPYATGQLTERVVVRTIVILSLITTLVGFVLNYNVLLWVGLYLLLGYIYSGPLRVKSRGVLAALLLGFCYGAMPWLIGGSVTGQLGEVSLLSMAFFSFIFSSGIIVIKDFKDLSGDRATNKKTLLVRKGPVYTRRYYLFTTSLAYALLVIYASIVNVHFVLIVTGLVLGCVNYRLLMTKLIFTSAHERAGRGKWARVLFFMYALTIYFASTCFSLI